MGFEDFNGLKFSWGGKLELTFSLPFNPTNFDHLIDQ